jgi:ribosomal protein RSM22 (predicted rRNA methylase)
VTLTDELREALDTATAGVDRVALTAAVERLISRYRTGGAAHEPILATPADVTAYAAYRMPATFGAARLALGQLALSRPDLRPRSLLDLGGGTGAAAWAACDVFPELAQVTVVDQVADALDLGRSLASGALHEGLRSAQWRTARLDAKPVPGADLVTLSYVLSELSPRQRAEVVSAAAGCGDAMVVLEPGTPDGYRRILAARTQLIAGGSVVVAPCPHDEACPLAADDWCHFAARINRSALHRRVKGGELGHEDEKFSYVAVLPAHPGRPAEWSPGPPRRRTSVAGSDPAAPARVLRHPVKRKGLVQLELCRPDGTASREIVSKRQGPAYRAARDIAWGDAWPPAT